MMSLSSKDRHPATSALENIPIQLEHNPPQQPDDISRPPSVSGTGSKKARNRRNSRNSRSTRVDDTQCANIEGGDEVKRCSQASSGRPSQLATTASQENNEEVSRANNVQVPVPEPPVNKIVNKSDTKKSDAIPKVQIEPDRKGWARLSDMYHKYDEERVRDAKEDIDTLLVFAGLFSAVLSAFVIETYQNLQEDPGDVHTRILTQISSQLATLAISGNFINSTIPSYNSSSVSFSTPVSFVRINTLWSCSLVISLITASLGILVKQWFHEYMAQDTQTPWLRLRIRFFRTEGIEKWQVFEFAAALPLLLQIAVILFFVGLSEFLRQLNPIVGWTTTGLMLIWLAIFVFTTIAPLLSSQCPYKTPILKRPLTYLRTLRPQLLLGALKTFYILPHIPLVPLLPIYWFLRYIGPTTYIARLDEKIHRSYNLVMNWITKLNCLPEEDTIVREDVGNFDNDIGIIVSSDTRFLDEQLKGIICECSVRIPILTIYEYYKKSLETQPETTRETGDSWRVLLNPEAKEKVEDVVDTILFHKHRNPGSDTAWPDTLRSIIMDDRHGPTLILKIMLVGNEVGARTIFFTLYSSSNEESFDHYNMYELYCRGARGDIVDSLIAITRLVGEHFWPCSSGPTSANSHLQEFIKERKIKKNLAAFCYTFSMLLLLASPEAIKNRRKEVRKLTSEILDILNRDRDPPQMPMRISLLKLHCAKKALGDIHWDEDHRGAVNSNLIMRLRELTDTAFRPAC